MKQTGFSCAILRTLLCSLSVNLIEYNSLGKKKKKEEQSYSMLVVSVMSVMKFFESLQSPGSFF